MKNVMIISNFHDITFWLFEPALFILFIITLPSLVQLNLLWESLIMKSINNPILFFQKRAIFRLNLRNLRPKIFEASSIFSNGPKMKTKVVLRPKIFEALLQHWTFPIEMFALAIMYLLDVIASLDAHDNQALWQIGNLETWQQSTAFA